MAVFDSVARAWRVRSRFEVRLLRLSIVATAGIALTGIVLGFLSGSLAIMFDGLFSIIDALVTLLMLGVARLVASDGNRRFQFGFWHLEPMVLGFKATILIILVGYGAINAVQSILAGGTRPQLGIALAYAAVTTLICLLIWLYLHRQNARLLSELVHLEQQGWMMSTFISAALLVGFVISLVIEGTALTRFIPYIDPFILAALSLVLLPVPLREARRAAAEIFEEAPSDLDDEVRSVMNGFVSRHGFSRFASYVSKVGRARFIEISVLVPVGYPPLSIVHYDALRAEIGDELGEAGPDRWLTIMFTADEAQL